MKMKVNLIIRGFCCIFLLGLSSCAKVLPDNFDLTIDKKVSAVMSLLIAAAGLVILSLIYGAKRNWRKEITETMRYSSFEGMKIVLELFGIIVSALIVLFTLGWLGLVLGPSGLIFAGIIVTGSIGAFICKSIDNRFFGENPFLNKYFAAIGLLVFLPLGIPLGYGLKFIAELLVRKIS